MISRTQIKKRLKRKTNPGLQETIILANKNSGWKKIAAFLSTSTRKYTSVNLNEIDKNANTGDIIVIPGKVLSKGEITKKVRICAIGISEMAKEKLKSSKSEFASLADEIKKNPKAEGIKLIR